MKELSIEQKAKRYDESLEQLKGLIESTREDKYAIVEKDIIDIFPELKEPEDEKVKRIIHSISNKISFHLHDIFTEEEFQCFDAWSNAWLKMQGNISKEVTYTQEVETGNGNIKALVTEKLDSTNKSTEDDVRRRSIIWVLEYARGLDTFNQYGKENIDKDIAWLEKQGIYKVWTDNDYDKVKSIEYLLHGLDNHNFDDWFNLLKRM